MSSNRKYALLVGAATCLLALIYAAPIFGADDSLLPRVLEAQVVADNTADNEAMMGPLREQAKAALARLRTASTP